MLKEQVVVVTGGAGLLGAAMCNRIANEGGVPIIADTDFERANQVAQGIRSRGLSAEAVSMNITDIEQINRTIDHVRDRFGRLDAVVNNAYPRSENYGRPLGQVSYEEFCQNLSLHLGGYFLSSQQFALAFQNQGHGNVVNMASIYGLHAPRFEIYAGTAMTMPVEYAAIKAGIIQLTRYFAQFYLKDGIRCNALAPGGIRDQQPEMFVTKYADMCGTKGLLDPSDIMGALMFLLSDSSRFMTGQVLVIDDGWSL
jgi:NAD(P)-dependent dehydrogenase (short-subunit alcohol dehydrogenase family)